MNRRTLRAVVPPERTVRHEPAAAVETNGAAGFVQTVGVLRRSHVTDEDAPFEPRETMHSHVHGAAVQPDVVGELTVCSHEGSVDDANGAALVREGRDGVSVVVEDQHSHRHRRAVRHAQKVPRVVPEDVAPRFAADVGVALDDQVARYENPGLGPGEGRGDVRLEPDRADGAVVDRGEQRRAVRYVDRERGGYASEKHGVARGEEETRRRGGARSRRAPPRHLDHEVKFRPAA